MDSDVGHFIAGFLDAEAHFFIQQQNTATSFSCGVSVATRDDDAELLEWLADVTGLGHVFARAAQGNAHPQAVWRITARADCVALAEILRAQPLRSRKAQDFRIWTRAVDALGTGSADLEALGDLSAQIRTVRRYVPAAHWEVPDFETCRAFDAYLGGFVTGDGHFSLASGPGLTVKLRQDDRFLLESFRRYSRFGSINDTTPRDGNPQAAWLVRALDECWSLSRRLDGHVRGRKARELEIWRAGIDEIVRLKACGARTRRTVVPIADRLVATRRYTQTDWKPRKAPARGRRCQVDPLDALRTWAAEEPGALSVNRYVAARRLHPGWPTRNTVAKRFGSWHAALEAAGLGDRAATDADRHARREARTRERRAQRREASRALLLDGVRRYLDAHPGREPAATEFFVWRRETGLEIPTQATMYTLFDGGWREVLRLAQVKASATSS
jgi:hypothetical protein